jgi:hypothetical protein
LVHGDSLLDINGLSRSFAGSSLSAPAGLPHLDLFLRESQRHFPVGVGHAVAIRYKKPDWMDFVISLVSRLKDRCYATD